MTVSANSPAVLLVKIDQDYTHAYCLYVSLHMAVVPNTETGKSLFCFYYCELPSKVPHLYARIYFTSIPN